MMKKILHVCLANYYVDNFGYQENILTREHKNLGYDVYILASTETVINNSKTGYVNSGTYLNEDQIEVTRIDYLRYLPKRLMYKLRLYQDVYKNLVRINPDIIFFHDIQFLSIFKFIKFLKKNKSITVYADSHTDLRNSAKNFISRYVLHGLLYKFCAQAIDPYVKQYWGVLPARIDFYVNIYKLPKMKFDLLLLGAEDQKVKAAKIKGSERIKKEYGIDINSKIVLTGGKIDYNKPEVLDLIRAFNDLNPKDWKLVIFGSIAEELKGLFDQLLTEKTIFLGWIQPDQTYDVLEMSDLIIFPGLHSVLWELSIGMGKPCVFRKINGFYHVNINGNCQLLSQSTKLELEKTMSDLLNNQGKLSAMRVSAEKIMKDFSYTEIAKRSINYE